MEDVFEIKKQNSKGGKIIKLYHVENIQVNSEKKKKKSLCKQNTIQPSLIYIRKIREEEKHEK